MSTDTPKPEAPATEETETTETALAPVETQEQPTELANVAPSFMTTENEDGNTGLDDLGTIAPPRLKIVQQQTGAPLSDLFNNGDVVCVPANVPVAEMQYDGPRSLNEGNPFFFTPVFFYKEWTVHNNIKLKGQEDFILGRTFDPADEIAVRATGGPKMWTGPHPEKGEEFPVRYVEHLNFVVVIAGTHPLAGVPMIYSAYKGEHKTGRNFCTLLKVRNVPLFGGQYQAVCRLRTKENQWFGLDLTNPAEGSGVDAFVRDKQRFERFKSLYHEFKAHHEKGVLRADYDTEGDAAEVSDSAAEF